MVYHSQQSSGHGVYAGQDFIPGPTPSLAQSLDVRPEITDPTGDALAPAHGGNTHPNWDGQDIDRVAIAPLDADTLNIRMHMKSQPGGPGVTNCVIFLTLGGSCQERIAYAVVWHYNNDVYFTGMQFYDIPFAPGFFVIPPEDQVEVVRKAYAGKPVSIPGPGAPLGFSYAGNDQMDTQVELHADGVVAPGVLDFHVPYSAIGGTKQGDLLRSVQGFTFLQANVPANADVSPVFQTQIDATAPFDYSVGNQAAPLEPPPGEVALVGAPAPPTFLPNTSNIPGGAPRGFPAMVLLLLAAGCAATAALVGRRWTAR
jgi:hypothetical protein